VEQEIPEGRPEKLAEFMSPEFRALVESAEAILGIDEETGNEFIVFGMSTLESIVVSSKSVASRVLIVAILQRTNELEMLCAVVRAVKGYIDYRAGSNYSRHQNS